MIEKEYSAAERDAIDAKMKGAGDGVQTVRKFDMQGWYTEIALPDGRVVQVWDQSSQDPTKAVLQVYDSAGQCEQGNCAQSIEF